MKINLILVDECGDEVVAETISAEIIEALGDALDDFVDVRIAKIEERYPECRGVYRETVKSQGELMCEEYQRLCDEYLEWALAHEDELDGYDPYEWAMDQANDEMANRNPFTLW